MPLKKGGEKKKKDLLLGHWNKAFLIEKRRGEMIRDGLITLETTLIQLVEEKNPMEKRTALRSI